MKQLFIIVLGMTYAVLGCATPSGDNFQKACEYDNCTKACQLSQASCVKQTHDSPLCQSVAFNCISFTCRAIVNDIPRKVEHMQTCVNQCAEKIYAPCMKKPNADEKSCEKKTMSCVNDHCRD